MFKTIRRMAKMSKASATYSTETRGMTPDEIAAFDRAFEKFDEAFDEIDKVFKEPAQ